MSHLGERPKEEASAQAWDMHYTAIDSAAHDAAAREYPDGETQNAWERYLHREQLLVLRDQLIQYGGARVSLEAVLFPPAWLSFLTDSPGIRRCVQAHQSCLGIYSARLARDTHLRCIV